MPATEYPIEIEQGATFERVLRLKDGGTVRNLTGCTARGQIRDGWGADGVKLADFTLTIPLPTNGEISWTLAASVSELLEGGSGVYDVELVEPDLTTVKRLVRGPVTITPGATRADP